MSPLGIDTGAPFSMAIDLSSVLATRTAEFPTAWTHPTDTGAPFLSARMHFPFPASPLEQTTIGVAVAQGFTLAAQAMRLPLKGMEVLYRNHYRFERYVMAQPASEAEAREAAAAAEATFQEEVGRMIERWYGEHLPALTGYHQRLAAMDVAAASPAGLIALVDEVNAMHAEIWDIHFRIGLPMMLSMQLFDEFYAEVFGGSEADGHAMLTGALSESVKAGFGLSDLAERARELGLVELFTTTPADELLPALRARVLGRAFLTRLDAFLDVYGLRQDLFQLSTPTWRENPSVALATIRSYLVAGHDARAEHAAITRAAEEAVAEARDTLAAFPEAVRGQFEMLLQLGRHGAFLQEEHNFYIDQQALARIRLFYVAVGKRLAELGMIETPDDVFMLAVHEIRDLLAGFAPFPASAIRERREELAVAATMTPPPFVGQPPAGPPPAESPLDRAVMRFCGGPPQASEDPGTMRGNAGSRGVVTGVARVARTLDEATSLQPGEILVAITTMPAWTPLFGVAAAVVTETGGVLSHCAIVAREYGIPGVVGTRDGTQRIPDGARVRVDGAAGEVRLLD